MKESPGALLGTVVGGDYRLEEVIGSGAMGTVYRATQLRLERPVAVKLIRLRRELDPLASERFRREALALARLRHPHIVTIHDFGVAADVGAYLVMECLEGLSIREEIHRRGRLPMRFAVTLVRQACGALAQAHAAGIVHRDLKPANLFLEGTPEAPRVKVVDFGIAKLDEDSHLVDAALTDTGVSMGTPAYMAPEHLAGESFDARADVYSLGCVLYEMLTGRPPFSARTTFALIGKHASERPPAPSEKVEGLPPALDALILKMLAKRPQDRPQSADELGEALLRFEQPEPEAASLLQWAAARLGLGKKEEKPPDPALFEGPTAAVAAERPPSAVPLRLEPVGGGVPLGSEFYIVRPADSELHLALASGDSIVLVKGARQMGKTSLLARALQQAREAGARVVLTDFQTLNEANLSSLQALFLALGELVADQLDIDALPGDDWKEGRSPNRNFERWLRKEVLAPGAPPVVWGMDEVDRLFAKDFGTELFALFRSWHNARALDPQGPWSRLTLAIAYATEAHLFITDVNQSPFNVGTRIALDDFTKDEVAELNRRHNTPLDPEGLVRFQEFLGGHPYLVRRGLHEMVTHDLDLAGLEAEARRPDGPFGDHLRRIVVLLAQEPSLRDVVKGVIAGEPCPTTESFYRLRNAGILSGDTPRDARPRCRLYADYLREQLA